MNDATKRIIYVQAIEWLEGEGYKASLYASDRVPMGIKTNAPGPMVGAAVVTVASRTVDAVKLVPKRSLDSAGLYDVFF